MFSFTFPNKQCLRTDRNYTYPSCQLLQTINTFKNGNGEFILSGSFQTPKIFNGVPLPNEIYKIELKRPVAITGNADLFINSLSFLGSTLFIDPLFKIKSKFEEYNSNSKLIRGFDKPDIVSQDGYKSVMWDKYSQKQSAKFSNAKYIHDVVGSECSYIGFEEGQTVAGPHPEEDFWNFDPNSNSAPIYSNEAHTGNSCQKINAASTNNIYSASKKFYPASLQQAYKVSVWIKTENNFGNVQNQDGELVLKLLDATGNNVSCTACYNSTRFQDTHSQWQYVETIFYPPSSHPGIQFEVYAVNYDPNHFFLIDDIVVRPLLATSNTYTYDKSTGMIASVSDDHNNPIYTEYDGLGRAYLIRDKDRNVIKKIAYNTTSYIEIFIRHNNPYPFINENITFNSNKSFSAKPFNYSWVIDDPFATNNSNISNTESFTYAFSHSGTYNYSLTITDQDGFSKSESGSITVADPISVPQISGNQNLSLDIHCSNANTVLEIDNAITGGYPPYTYRWTDHADPNGYFDTGTIVSWGFNLVGGHTIDCKVTDSQGNHSQGSIHITVTSNYGCP